MAVDADGKNLDVALFFFGEETFQLSELTRAIGSPMATIKDQNDVFLLPEVGKGNSFAVHVLQREVRRLVPNLDSIEVGRFKVGPVFGPQLGMRR